MNFQYNNSSNAIFMLDSLNTESKLIKLYSAVLYVIVIVTCVIFNSIVIITMIRDHNFRHTKNYFLLNIAIADLLVGAICMSSNILFEEVDKTSTMNLVLCKAIPFLQGTTITSSIYSFMGIAIERYIVLTKPYGSNLPKKHCITAILAIWTFSFISYSPKLVVNRVADYGGKNVCDEFGWTLEQSKHYVIAGIVLTYGIPVTVSSIAYGRAMNYLWHRKIPGSQDLPEEMQRSMRKMLQRAKVCRRMLRILMVFIVTHLPSSIVTILWYFGEDMKWTAPPYMWIIAFHAEILRYANSAINPILFFALDPSFRSALRLNFWKRAPRSNAMLTTSTSV